MMSSVLLKDGFAAAVLLQNRYYQSQGILVRGTSSASIIIKGHTYYLVPLSLLFVPAAHVDEANSRARDIVVPGDRNGDYCPIVSMKKGFALTRVKGELDEALPTLESLRNNVMFIQPMARCHILFGEGGETTLGRVGNRILDEPHPLSSRFDMPVWEVQFRRPVKHQHNGLLV